MYLVTINNNVLHDPRIKDYQALNPVLNLEVNKTHSFNFTIYPNNPMFNSIERLKSIIEVYDDGELIFRGRPLNDTTDFNKATTIQCEGELAYLNDSTMEPYSYFGNVRGLLELYINNHNSQVDASKQFTLGTVNVPGDFVRSNIGYTNTWEELSTKTFGSGMGGYLRLRRQDGINYIDYLSDSLYISGQTIELSKNLLDYEKTVKASDIVTVLIPLGAKLKDEEGNETDERLTIESVNAGSKFIEHTNGISKYGRIVGYKVWDDINTPALLKTRATNDLNFLVNLGISIKIKAIDLNVLDKSIPKIRFFEYVKIISKPHEIDDSMLIKKQTIHLDDPSQNTIEVGVEVSSFTDKQLEANNTIKIIKSDYVTNEKLTNVVTPLTTQVSEIIQESDLIKLSVLEIGTDLENIHLGNIYVNSSGELGNYFGWSFPNTNTPMYVFGGLYASSGMTQFTNFEIIEDNNSLSGSKISFFGNGKATQSLVPVINDRIYSFKTTRVKGTQTLNIVVSEYDSDRNYIKNQTFPLPTNVPQEFTLSEFNSSTAFVSVEWQVSGVTLNNRLEFTETMFAIGQPKDYFVSSDNVRLWAESKILVLNNEILLNSTEIDAVSGAIHNAGVEINAQEGVTTRGKKFRVLSEDGTETYMVVTEDGIESHKMTAIDMVAVNANVTGTINAVRGEIGNFEIENGVLDYVTPEYNRQYTNADMSEIKSIYLSERAVTNYEKYIYDLDENGVIDGYDIMIVKRAILGLTDPIIKPIKSRVRIGTLDGKVTSEVLYGPNNSIGASFTMQAERLQGMLVDTKSISTSSMLFNGQEVYVENGTLKVRNI